MKTLPEPVHHKTARKAAGRRFGEEAGSPAAHYLRAWPPRLDQTMLEGIETGRFELSDDLFFELLAESPGYLMEKCFQLKIAQWQAWLSDPYLDSETKLKADDRLKKIGEVLSKKIMGRPKSIDSSHVQLDFAYIIERIPEILAMEEKQRQTKFMELLPAYMQFVDIYESNGDGESFWSLPSALEMAKAICMARYGVSKRTVDAALKEKVYPGVVLKTMKSMEEKGIKSGPGVNPSFVFKTPEE